MTFFKKDEFRLLWPFYLDALTSIMFIFPAFLIIYFKSMGFSLLQIGFITSFWALPGLLFEVPTGAVADIKGRKLSTLIGYISEGIILFLFFFAKDYVTVLTFMFLLGIAGTFVSGARDAWVVDLLKKEKRKELIQEYFSKRQSFYCASFLVAGILGALLVKAFGLGIIWPISGFSFFVGAAGIMFGKEYFVKKKRTLREHSSEFISHTKKSISYTLKHHVLSLIIMATIFGSFIYAFSSDMLWLPFLQSMGFKEYYFGYLFSATFALGIFVPYFITPLIKKIGKYKTYLALVLGIMALLSISVLFIKSIIPGLIIFILSMSIWDFFYPAKMTLFQRFTPSKMRATITSFESMVASTVIIVASPLAGWIGDNIGSQKAIFISLFFILPSIYLYLRIKERRMK